jgi:hypothetical protein
MDGYISKPIRMAELEQVIGEAMKMRVEGGGQRAEG